MNITEMMLEKRVLIWGYGVEGKSTESFLKRYCKTKSIDIYEGEQKGIREDEFDIIIKSPGIVMDGDNPKYTSQTELFLNQFRNQIIGVTGTKGKSTTSSMLYKVIRDCGYENVVLVGNIGIPCLDFYGEINEKVIVVYEMSCHQLAHTKVSPHIAVFLNLYEEHLDYYKTFENYFKAKTNITKFQSQDDFFFVGENVPNIYTLAKKVVVKDKREMNLMIKGEHNNYNSQFVYLVATSLLKCNKEKVMVSLENFKGLSHRLEYIGIKNGIRFYDDSIATIPAATIYAVKSIEKVQTVIIGGMDRKINYDSLIDFIKFEKEIFFICAYESGERIFNSLHGISNCFLVKDLKQAVEKAMELTNVNYACILSPAAASYGHFKNFEERGNKFKQYVMSDTKDNY